MATNLVVSPVTVPLTPYQPNQALDVAVKNRQRIQEAIPTTPVAGQIVTIQLPKGVFAISGALTLYSNVILTGVSQAETTLILDASIRSVGLSYRPDANPAPSEAQASVQRVTITQLTLKITEEDTRVPPIDITSEQLKNYAKNGADAFPRANFSCIDIGNRYLDPTLTFHQPAYQPNEQILIQHVTIDGSTPTGCKGENGISIRNTKGVLIKQCTIRGIGEKNGIVVQECDQVTIEMNTVSDVGRSGILVYFRNTAVLVKENTITNWLQRYGALHYVMTYRAYMQAESRLDRNKPDSNSDSAIYAYGPMNEGMTITGNTIIARTQAANPCNAQIQRFWNAELAADKPVLSAAYTQYAGIRIAGTYAATVTQNRVELETPEALAFVVISAKQLLFKRKDNESITSFYGGHNIQIQHNQFYQYQATGSTSSMVTPIRLFNILPPNYDTIENWAEDMPGILIDQNTFSVEGHITHAYQTLCELHLGNEAHDSDTIASAITITNNQLHIPTWKQGNRAFFTLQKENFLGVTRQMVLHNFEMWGNQFTDLTPPIQTILLAENIDVLTQLELQRTVNVAKQQVTVQGTWQVLVKDPDAPDGASKSVTYYNQATFSGKTVPIVHQEPFQFQLAFDDWQQAEKANALVSFQDTDATVPTHAKTYAFLPTIAVESYVFQDVYLKGSYTGPATKVTLFVNGNAARNGALNANGGANTLSIYVSDLIRNLTDVVEVALFDAAGNEIARQKVPVNAVRPAVLPSPYLFGAHSVIGTYTGAGDAIRLYVNGSQVKTGELQQDTASFTIWAKDLIPSKTDTVEVVLLDSTGKEIARSRVIITEMASLKVASYLLTSDTITGTYTGLVNAIQLRVNGQVVPVDVRIESTTKHFVMEQVPTWVQSTEDTVVVELLDTAGQVLATAIVVLVDPPAVSPEPYPWNNQTITGMYRGQGDTVQLWVNGEMVKRAAVQATDYTFSIWAQGLLPSKDAAVDIVLCDKNKMEIARATVVVTDPPSITPKLYLWQNPTITGTFTGLGASVTLYANGKVIKTASVNGDNTFSIYAYTFIDKVTDVVEIALVDSQGREIARSNVRMTVIPTIQPDIYLWGTTAVTGTFTGSESVVKYVKLLENGKQIHITGGLDFATTSFGIYAYNVIKNKGSLVEVALCDTTETEMARAKVTIKQLPSISPNQYPWKSTYVSGSYIDTDELAKKVRLLENGKVIATGQLDTTKGGFLIYASAYITSLTAATANLTVVLYDSQDKELVKNTVTII
ncbi:right-handed parallel beta-helix repeat-containing protein [Listeria booriae]|uniref:right-handed parallel beta-helix repeat-containing protein n=1 Tax=Listeria booriae TaxID=1552123 RepID=UPI0016296CB2|nr:right-handed parallel beta-helix repeat-containing protein [Listeria booriae]MBC2189443.1 hypothetical protein [Listeria booriae]